MHTSAGSGARIVQAFRRWGGAIRRHPVRSIAALPLAFAVYVAAHYPFTPSIGDIRKAKQEQPTVVLSADGKELATFQRANRDWVKLEEISPVAVDALLATEDHRFYEHNGIDFARTAKAVLNTLRGDVEGGSTLTQQLARNLYPEEIGREQTVTRKIKEAITALKIEAIYSKDEILETYLNSVSFLYNAWGIEMAARTYFDKPAGKLNELEAATLVGMLKGTSHYNPVLNPERALQRRNTVLALMVKHEKLPEGRYENLKEQPLKLDFERLKEFRGPAPHLAQHLKRWLLDWANRHDYNIYADGLVVRTTIDSRLQAMANEAVQRQGEALQAVADVEWATSGGAALGTRTDAYVARAGKVDAFAHFWNKHPGLLDAFVRDSERYRSLREEGVGEDEALAQLKDDAAFVRELRRRHTTLQAGFMALDPQTGHVKAWVGSRDYEQDKFDHVQQARRQPGSTFKPFVYGAAFEMGMAPNETFMDAPVEIEIDRNKVWRPGDVGGATNAPMTLREGLARSKNSITAQLMMQVGPSRVARLAREMGVRESQLEAVPSLALGTSPVTLKEMVTAFGTIANGGNYIEPVLVTSIEDREGRVLERFHPPTPEPALAHDAAMTLLDVMRGVIETGTAVGLKHRFGLTGDLAGKTGTTQDNTDGWFILMHPQLVAGAWMGFNDNRVRMRSEYWGQGSHNALLVVGDFFKKASGAGLVDSKAAFAAPRMKDLEKPLLQQMGDWWNSVFSTPAEPPQEEVAALPPVPPPVELPPLQLEPPPASLDAPTALPEPPPLPALPALPEPPPVSPEAPVIADPLRVPAFPRPLEQAAQPVETVPGTQVYPLPEPARSDTAARSGRRGGELARSTPESSPAWDSTGEAGRRTAPREQPASELVLEPRPWEPPAGGSGRERRRTETSAETPATSVLGAGRESSSTGGSRASSSTSSSGSGSASSPGTGSGSSAKGSSSISGNSSGNSSSSSSSSSSSRPSAREGGTASLGTATGSTGLETSAAASAGTRPAASDTADLPSLSEPPASEPAPAPAISGDTVLVPGSAPVGQASGSSTGLE